MMLKQSKITIRLLIQLLWIWVVFAFVIYICNLLFTQANFGVAQIKFLKEQVYPQLIILIHLVGSQKHFLQNIFQFMGRMTSVATTHFCHFSWKQPQTILKWWVWLAGACSLTLYVRQYISYLKVLTSLSMRYLSLKL